METSKGAHCVPMLNSELLGQTDGLLVVRVDAGPLAFGPGSAEVLQSPGDVTAFRGIAARGIYLVGDRPELQFAAKEVARYMAKPTHANVVALRRIARFIDACPRLVQTMRYQGEFVPPRAYCGDRASRKVVDWLCGGWRSDCDDAAGRGHCGLRQHLGDA